MKARFLLTTEQAETLKEMEYANTTVTPMPDDFSYSEIVVDTDEDQMFLFELFTKGQKFGIEQVGKRLVKQIFE